MTYIDLKTHAVTTLSQVRRMLPHMSIPPGADLSAHGYAPIHQAPAPAPLPDHHVEQDAPNLDAAGRWIMAWRQVPLTPDEIKQRHADKATEVRAERDRLLADSDWIAVSSYERGQAVPQAWVDYRQALRDVTAQPGFPWAVEWPDLPA